MSASAPSAPPVESEDGPIVIATALPAPEDGLVRVGWARTIARLALEPRAHPWAARWRLRDRMPLALVLASALLLLLFAASGCASTPLESVRGSTVSPRPPRGLRCESLLVSREVQVPPEGELADLRLTVDDIPPVTGKLRVLVRRPRFAATLELQTDQPPEFDRVLELSPGAGQRSLTVVLARPRRASGDWPRRDCKACRVDVEITGLFGAPEALEGWFAQAMQDATAIERAFSGQASEPATRPATALKESADAIAAEASRCGVALDAPLQKAQGALAQLDAARARLYSAEPDVPDAATVLKSWEAASAAMDGAVASAARGAGWPASLRLASAGRLRVSALHLDASAQLASLPPEDRRIAAKWTAVALAQDPALLPQRISALPAIRDLDDARARLEWVDARRGAPLPIPGIAQPAALRVRDLAVVLRGKRCIGPGGAAPVRNAQEEARSVARLLGAPDLRIGKASDIGRVREALRQGTDLLCEQSEPDVAQLFQGLEGKDLGPIADQLEEIFREADPRTQHDEISRAVLARTSQLLCRVLDADEIQRRVSTVAGYRVFVEGGTRVLETLPQPLICGNHVLTAREVRRRLKVAYRAALDSHAVSNRLCPLRGGKCPDEIAGSVSKIFNLRRPDLAALAPTDSRRLDYPPAFGFSDEWVQKLDRCAREACEALSRLRSEAPIGDFEGAVCPVREETEDRQQEVTLANPESPTSVTLSSCDAHAGVRLTLHRLRDAGTLVSIASNHPFRYGSENVTRQGKHPQLGRIYERVADLSDPEDVSRRTESIFEVALTPTVSNQVFYFFSLRRRDY
jgi:hypothetical protein